MVQRQWVQFPLPETFWGVGGPVVSEQLKGSKNRKIVTSVLKLTLTEEKKVIIGSGV